jgi:hypothetical protein
MSLLPSLKSLLSICRSALAGLKGFLTGFMIIFYFAFLNSIPIFAYHHSKHNRLFKAYCPEVDEQDYWMILLPKHQRRHHDTSGVALLYGIIDKAPVQNSAHNCWAPVVATAIAARLSYPIAQSWLSGSEWKSLGGSGKWSAAFDWGPRFF